MISPSIIVKVYDRAVSLTFPLLVRIAKGDHDEYIIQLKELDTSHFNVLLSSC